MNCCALVPCYKPDGRLLETLAALKKAGFDKFVLTDDGNGAAAADLFARASSEYGADIVTHAVNLGKGRAMKSAFNFILGRYPGCGAVTVDCDGQHPPEAAVRAAELTSEYPDSLILGCRRFASTENIPLPNFLGNTLTRTVVLLLTGMRFSDTQCGLRGYPPEIMRRLIGSGGERFEFETNVLLDARRNGLKITEFPMKATYERGADYTTTFDRTADSARIYSVLLSFALLPALWGLVSSLGVALTTSAALGAVANGAVAAASVAVGKLLLTLTSRRGSRCALGGLLLAAVYGAAFGGLIALGLAPKCTLLALWLPFTALSYPVWRVLSFGRRGKIVRLP